MYSFFYASINEDGICVGISEFTEPVTNSNMIPIPEADYDLMWRKYDNGVWSDEKYPPEEPSDPLDILGQLSVQNSLKLNNLETKIDILGQAVTQILLKGGN